MPAVAADMAGYVLYYRMFGDWSAICSRDEATGNVLCVAESPPPTSVVPPAVVLRVRETAPETYAVSAAFRANVAPGAAAALRVDDGADRVVALDAGYEAHFSGAEAAGLVAEMLAGRVLTVRGAGHGSDAQPILVGVPLVAFRGALEAMRMNLRQHGGIRHPG